MAKRRDLIFLLYRADYEQMMIINRRIGFKYGGGIGANRLGKRLNKCIPHDKKDPVVRNGA